MATVKPSRSLSLTRSELTQCKRLFDSDGLTSQRAKALVAIHEGKTHSAAAEVSDLSLGQVRYIVSRFRLHRMKALQTEAFTTSVSKAAGKTAKVQSDKKNKKDKKKDKNKKAKKDKGKSKDKKKTKSDKKTKKDKKKSKKSKK